MSPTVTEKVKTLFLNILKSIIGSFETLISYIMNVRKKIGESTKNIYVNGSVHE